MKTKALRVLSWVLLAVAAVGLVVIVRQKMGLETGAKAYDEAARLAGFAPAQAADAPEDTPAPSVTRPQLMEEDAGPAAETPRELPEEARHLENLDLPALRAVNEQVCGWIEIPGTPLSYPLVQGEDNQYYLTHTWTFEYSPMGAIYFECTNQPDLSDFHTLIYGHRMMDDTSMFSSLKEYKSLDYWQKHPSVYLAMEDGVHQYDIFSAHQVRTTEMVYRLDVADMKEDFYLYCIENSDIQTGVMPQRGDQILTLSTCANLGSSVRWVVHAIRRY
ncbi:MAG: class B sortase [Oscillospiraceae bacterium]|nr:class B sortase [Oscillospiraceae bacterium]